MEIDIQNLIDKLEKFIDKMENYLSEDDDFLLAVVLAVLEEVKDYDK